MSVDNDYRDAFNLHQSTQIKFEYFFLGVILAALSLSVQTFNPTVENQQVLLIYASWFLFLISFLAGFFRQERSNLSYMIVAQTYPDKKKKKLFEEAIDGTTILKKSATETWTEKEIQESLENTNSILDVRDSYLRKYEKHVITAYQIQKWSFFYAVYLYIVFKVSNYSDLSITLIIIISLALIIINILLVVYYKKLLNKK